MIGAVAVCIRRDGSEAAGFYVASIKTGPGSSGLSCNRQTYKNAKEIPPMRFIASCLIFFTLASVAWSQTPPERRIALSFDDVPRQRGAFLTPDERTARLIAALREAGVDQAVFFITPGRLRNPDGVNGEAHVKAYVDAGHVIANHSNDHKHLTRVTADDYLNDLDLARKWLQDRPGFRPWFRFPYLDEGGDDKVKRDAVRRGLEARGLINGHVTADGSDWNLESLTVDAVKAGKTLDMDALRKLYVTSQMSGVAYHDELARRALGRSPVHMLLLHETDLAALFIGDLVAELRRHGWTIATADQAYSDPIKDVVTDVPHSAGTLTGSIAWQRDIKPPLWPIWMSPGLVRLLFDRRVVKTEAAAEPTK